MTFRKSQYIDFDAGVVMKSPMSLNEERRRPWSPADMMDLFECRVDVWQLGPSVEILKRLDSEAGNPQSVWAHGAYALLGLVFTYFEMVGKTLNPGSKASRTAGDDFSFGFCDVYPASAPAPGIDITGKEPADVAAFRDRVRNGIYHLGYTKGDLFLWNDPAHDDFFIDRTESETKYFVNPHAVTRTIIDHFPGFMGRVRSSSELQPRFVRFFQEFHGLR